jgi:hypothetical protein
MLNVVPSTTLRLKVVASIFNNLTTNMLRQSI